jgi:hypothetical protein
MRFDQHRSGKQVLGAFCCISLYLSDDIAHEGATDSENDCGLYNNRIFSRRRMKGT